MPSRAKRLHTTVRRTA